MATVNMVTTGDLFAGKNGKKYQFILPAYQRGYRWRSPENNSVTNTESSQILQLLEDIKEYLEKTAFAKKFYCMQPVVVAKKSDNEYYLVDGQQRLTTFYLLYKFLKYDIICPPDAREFFPENEIAKRNEKLNHSVFTLKYECRNIEDWLNNIQNIQQIVDSTVDKYFLSSAYLCIKKWFESLPPEEKWNSKFLDLLEQTSSTVNVGSGKDIPRSLQFIWYELDGNECSDQEKLFQRLNKGKLPLTSAELIKAFLFGEFDRKIQEAQAYIKENPDDKNANQCLDNAEKDKERFEKEWEEYENAMQDEAFWYFISKYNYDTRLEYLFELSLKMNGVKDASLCSGQNVEIPQHTFYLFKKSYDERFHDGGIESARIAFFEYYQKLRKYYRDWELYHLIGCLIHLDKPMNEICTAIKDVKLISDAGSVLKRMIKDTLFSDVSNMNNLVAELEKLNYNSPKNIRKVLLAFNIAIILSMKQKSVFFDFSQYFNGSWDLEHICSQNQDISANKQDQWLNTIVDYFLGTAFVPPPPGFEDKEEASSREKLSREIFKKWYDEKSSEIDSDDFENILKSQYKDNKSRKTLENYILYGIYQIKYGNITKEKLWKIIFQLVNILERDGEAEPKSDDGLRNITLLDAQTNRSYKDAPFFVKRKHIIAVEGEGRYILPGTRNVFLKTYSNALDNMLFWDPIQDGQAYFEKISNTLAEFFSLNNK